MPTQSPRPFSSSPVAQMLIRLVLRLFRALAGLGLIWLFVEFINAWRRRGIRGSAG